MGFPGWALVFCLLLMGGGERPWLLIPGGSPQGEQKGSSEGFAQGVVFWDKNGNGVREKGEPGIRGVRVSNQREIVFTDREGRWRLPVEGEDTIFFVIKPRGWTPPVDEWKLPRFYHIYKPAGSPPLRYKGVDPTGPLPPSFDFPLQKQEEKDEFRVVVFGDTQPRNEREVEYLAHDVVEELIGVKAAFGVTLGDLVFDDLSLLPSYIRTMAQIGIPWHNVLGNHDMNYDAPDDKHSDETFERYFGPSYYSFDYGPVHFIVLDDVKWIGGPGGRGGHYTAALGERQMEFLRNDLRLVPQDQLVVLFMHIPLVEVEDREELYRLLKDHPYTLSVSAHRHYQAHFFLTAEDGWKGTSPHHHVVNVTACGSWWQGAPDESGIPHATMSDGVPNGYSVFMFFKNSYTIQYKPARLPGDYQMRILLPEEVSSSEGALVYVNVFAGSARSVVEMRVDEGDWLPLRRVIRRDPFYEALVLRDRQVSAPYRPLPPPTESFHLWMGVIPRGLLPGYHRVEVRTRDMFGAVYSAFRLFRVR